MLVFWLVHDHDIVYVKDKNHLVIYEQAIGVKYSF